MDVIKSYNYKEIKERNDKFNTEFKYIYKFINIVHSNDTEKMILQLVRYDFIINVYISDIPIILDVNIFSFFFKLLSYNLRSFINIVSIISKLSKLLKSIELAVISYLSYNYLIIHFSVG